MRAAQFWHHRWNWTQTSISPALILTGQTSVQTQNLFVLCKWTRRAGVIYNRHQGDIRFISWCPTAILQLASPISQPPSFLSCNFILNTNGYAVKRGRNNPRPTVNDSSSWMHNWIQTSVSSSDDLSRKQTHSTERTAYQRLWSVSPLSAQYRKEAKELRRSHIFWLKRNTADMNSADGEKQV